MPFVRSASFMLSGLVLMSGLAAGTDKPLRQSGNAFLPPGLHALQLDAASSPITLSLDQGLALWSDRSRGTSCQDCHGPVASLRTAAARYPKLHPASDKLINLEDQIVQCRQRGGHGSTLESAEVLALSALLHQAGRGQPIDVQPPPDQKPAWEARLQSGASLYSTRLGRMNLACVHCHDQSVGRQMRADIISPGHPTGFPIYRMAWQSLGSIDRRLRACFSGVQAELPPPGDSRLRDLELYLKVRASGMPLDGPSIRR